MNTRRMTGTVLVAVLATSGLLLAGCGSSASSGTPAGGSSSSASSSTADNGVASLTATEILAKAKAAAQAEDSVHFAGLVSGTGLDLVVTRSDGASGTITSDGNSVTLVVSGTSVYIKGSSAFWTKIGGAQGAAVAALIGDRWVKASTTNAAFASLTQFTDFASLVDSSLKPTGSITKGSTSEVDGIPVIGLVDGSASGGGTLYVATTGSPLPLKVVPSTSTTNEGIVFSDWGTATPEAAPAAADVLDFSKLLTAGN